MLAFNQSKLSENIKINEGSGFFIIEGGEGHKTDTITVHYHKPKNINPKSRILIVIPGAGRNGDDYRDSWVEASKKYNVLILSPSYSEKSYSYGKYHLGGVVKDLDLTKGITFKKNTNQVWMNEDLVDFKINEEENKWIYRDFDRIFDTVKKAIKSKQREYDMFGHSAGGQILHRFVLTHHKSKASKILASNAGTYTLPDKQTNFPFGIKDIDIDDKALKIAFRKNLVLFLGELDNADETRGRMLRSITADKQGTHRLARGIHFYNYSKQAAKKAKLDFNWKLEVIPGVGHNQKDMARAAAEYLYEK